MPTATWERLPEARREAVLRAAEAEFAAHGFSGGSLNAIARTASVAKGSLFQYFSDKADLYAHLADLASRRIRAAMEQRIAELPWEAGFFPAFRQLARDWVAYFAVNPLDRAFTAAVNLEPDMTARSAVREAANSHYLEVLRPLLRTARDAGELRANADLDAFLALLLVLLPHLALAPHNPGLDPVLGLGSGDPERIEESVDRLVNVLVAAFAAPDARR
ncbi:helix-turn-helix domain-containing protein [Saccharopolyspora hirsuta]|uniref:TetR/AcrR family transcriptional regulator n=1 Tax=Saccharopolyspora hirsuta TaxID=1837 RepID=A0A5M7BW60_SACHI|nr:TetR/AcrR family transcriptional regulator [Saccharopolyspora hirsuta]KAA5830585.1 TetR/AcrR family transcriptional regulator [Saccharopolyspora hirsuta]